MVQTRSQQLQQQHAAGADAAADGAASDDYTVLVTGANTGLGFAICCRLMDEFLHTRPAPQRICLVLCTRSTSKGNDTVARLQEYLRKQEKQKQKQKQQQQQQQQQLLPRVELRTETVDLSHIASVQQLARKMLADSAQGRGVRRLDAIVCNAGTGGWTGINFPLGVYSILCNWLEAVTYPTFKLSAVGVATAPQHSSPNVPPVGSVFCSNVFGHYLLGHYLTPLLSAASRVAPWPGRIVWISSMEAYEHALRIDDIQGLASTSAYESSKRLTDVLALSTDFPSTQRSLQSYASPSKHLPLPLFTTAPPQPNRPKHYLAHPGVCATSIMPLPLVLHYLIFVVMYVARWIGSAWHTLDPYRGAVAPVWLALAPQEDLDAIERAEGKAKWGSSTDFWGRESVLRTEVEAWGWGGRDGEVVTNRRGKRPRVPHCTREDRERFDDEARAAWATMEELREEWEERLERLTDVD